MSEMIERVAKAMWDSNYTTPWDSSPIDAYLTEKFRSRAAVAIAAMREPTAKMVDEGHSEACCHVWHYDGEGAGFDKDGTTPFWQAMIDEALR